MIPLLALSQYVVVESTLVLLSYSEVQYRALGTAIDDVGINALQWIE